MDNPEKPSTQGTHGEKRSKTTTAEYMFDNSTQTNTNNAHKTWTLLKTTASRLSYLSLIFEISMTIYNFILLQSGDWEWESDKRTW